MSSTAAFGQFYGPAESFGPGLSLHHSELYQPQSITEAGGSVFSQKTISSPRELLRQGKLISHTIEGWQTRAVCSGIKLNSSARQKKPPTQQPRAYGGTTSVPGASLRASFPPPEEVFFRGGKRRRRKCLSSLGAAHGRGRGRDERVWGRQDEPIPCNPIARGSGAGPSLGSCWRAPAIPLPLAQPCPSHPHAGKPKAPLPPKGREGGHGWGSAAPGAVGGEKRNEQR